jgi:hypothetical protein
MISSEKMFLFLHLPKTGGNSIQSLLASYSDEALVTPMPHQDGIERFELSNPNSGQLGKHASFTEYRSVYGRQVYDMFLFCCIRNPFERLVSYFHSPHRGPVAWSSRAFRKFVRSGEVKPLEHFLHDPDAGRGIEPDAIIRFETLQQDFDRVCKALDIPCADLPVRNRSCRPDYRTCFDSGLIRYVESKYARELELGGYTF